MIVAKFDEITQLQAAYHALQTQPFDAQQRMLAWLTAKLMDDQAKAEQAKREAAKSRVRKTSAAM